MMQRAAQTSEEELPDPLDFDRNHMYLKKLIQELKKEDVNSVSKEIFGLNNQPRPLTKKEMKHLYRMLRKIEQQYDECAEPPIPRELEENIREREFTQWLPWELEAIQKAEAWREEILPQRTSARQMLEAALEKIRRGEKLA